MRPGLPRPPALVAVLVIVAAVGVCAIAAATMVPSWLGGVGAWPVFAGGLVALVAALLALWAIQKSRDRTLR